MLQKSLNNTPNFIIHSGNKEQRIGSISVGYVYVLVYICLCKSIKSKNNIYNLYYLSMLTDCFVTMMAKDLKKSPFISRSAAKCQGAARLPACIQIARMAGRIMGLRVRTGATVSQTLITCHCAGIKLLI